MSLPQPYRPRRPTLAQQAQDEEQRLVKRKRQVEKKQRERQQLAKRSSKMAYSELNGVGYQDFTLGPSTSTKSRTQLDRGAYAEYRAGLVPQERPQLDRVPSLVECCLDLIAETHGETNQFVAIDRAHHLNHVKPLFDRVKRTRDDPDALLPFRFWFEFALAFGLDLPDRYKTYRGLVVSSDTSELEAIAETNAEASRLWDHQPTEPVPTFFLATLDLSNDRSFADSDMYKLRNPLSSFLAVLKLDGTRVTDGGIAWIARAADDSQSYRHLEYLSLKGLTDVTNEGVVKLSRLPNLRMLDVRKTGCDGSILERLRKCTHSSPAFSPPRARNDLPNPILELQLFGGSYSSSRVLTCLRYLADVQHASIQTVREVTRCRPVKPLSVHLSAMTRRPIARVSKQESKSAEELYREQLTLSGFSGSALATHSSTFGTLTSTKSLARKLVDDDGRAVNEHRAAFRTGIDDAVANGDYIGPGRTGGRTSLYELGLRKLSKEEDTRKERDPFSDTEDEQELEEALRKAEADELREWEEKRAGAMTFYAGRRPVAKPERVIVAAEQSMFTLLRHLPYVPPYARQTARAEPNHMLSNDGNGTKHQESRSRDRIKTDGMVLQKKKRRIDLSAGSSPSSARPTLIRASSASSSVASSSSPCATPPCAQPGQPRSNPFAKTSSSFGARTSSKNVVRSTSTLAKRSSLSAFKR
ncbi:uncharacterized protein JCM15063_001689 [Sporobolomyces koalae]|uniref:uncharacterized protein n=1 Tax=Sporobolomyces koalae TaxID=500713 RepID=UPI0031739928